MASAGDLPIRGIYEVVVRVADLDRAQDFYCSTLGLDPGLIVDERGMRFLRAGNGGMLVLQRADGEFPQQHFAFTIEEGDIEKSLARLTEGWNTVRRCSMIGCRGPRSTSRTRTATIWSSLRRKARRRRESATIEPRRVNPAAAKVSRRRTVVYRSPILC